MRGGRSASEYGSASLGRACWVLVVLPAGCCSGGCVAIAAIAAIASGLGVNLRLSPPLPTRNAAAILPGRGRGRRLRSARLDARCLVLVLVLGPVRGLMLEEERY
eukprot:CAMPEP_0119503862 /NCGR_PEP_ID=MMETSP1344-20130328/24900_1 /TAXON_ID=236787 /ORGANISM="Florenciella parvula, Strain CCMP2471" /LENGTH=104 /DNA_ID=CAMNT_0007540191 /DNA_START=78 /DNA_END=392 /DNA_ORIENTATION=-